MTLELLLLIGSLGATVALMWLAFRPWRQQRAERERLSRLINREQGTGAEVRPASSMKRLLMSAGIELSPVLVTIVLVVIAGAFAAALAMMLGRNPWVALVAGVFALWLCFSAISEAGRLRVWRFESRFVDAIDLVSGALSAGEEPVEAFEHAAESSQYPVKGELHALANRIRASVPIEAAVQPLAERYDCEAVRLFTQLLIAKWEIGGELAPSLKDISKTVRNGVRLRRQLHSSISGAQIAGIIIALLPYVLLTVYVLKRPDALTKIWTYAYGPQLFFGAVLLQIVGLVWLRRILRTEL